MLGVDCGISSVSFPTISVQAAKSGVCVLLLAGVAFAGDNGAHRIRPVTRRAARHDVSRPLREMPLIPPTPGPSVRVLDNEALHHIPESAPQPPAAADPLLQTSLPNTPTIPATSKNFEGIGNLNFVLPPDTNGAIGRNHYLQVVNLSFAIFDRNGNYLYGPASTNTLWQGFGGACESNNDGDPIAVYDQLADRWLVSQLAVFGVDGFHQCIAVSQTGDPTGAWYRYDFLVSQTLLNDYPKFGVWPDGYYMSVNQFAGCCFAGAGVYAFERDRMLLGLPAQMVYFDVSQINSNFGGLLPSTLDGYTPPPAGAPNYFANMEDDAWGTVADDEVQVFQFHVDWNQPSNSTFTGPQAVDLTAAGAGFDSNLCNYNFCIPQPGAPALDTLADRLMYRLAYRNFGGHESLVVNHSVDTNAANHAGVRWYEIRDPGGSPPSLFQAGTYSPDASHRWMGSIAMDASGDIGLGYSVSSSTVHPSLRYTGRLASDPLGTMPQGEGTLIAGGGSQTYANERWGDYSSMAVDPLDDCTFWFTSEYYAVTSQASWQTRVGAFKFPSCVSPPLGTLQGRVSDASTGLPLANSTIQIGGFTRVSDASGMYRFDSIPTGSFAATASHFGYSPQTADPLAISNGATTVQDFVLSAAALTQVQGTITDASGHGWPLYARITIADPLPSPVFSDPLTGAYSFSAPQQATLHLTVQAESPGYENQSSIVTVPIGGLTQDFQLIADTDSCAAPGYVPAGAFVESFSTGALPAGWIVTDNSSSGAVWLFDDPLGLPNFTGGSGGYAIFNSYYYGPGANEDSSLISPSVDLSGLASAYLHFDSDFIHYEQEVADVDVSVNGGASWTNVWRRSGSDSPGPDHEVVNITSLAAGHSNVKVRFRYHNAFWEWWWQVDEVRITESQSLTCSAVPGGLVIGAVSSASTSAALNGATVRSVNVAGESTSTFATPSDAALPDGFYLLFSSLTGTQPFKASHSGYEPLSHDVAVVSDGVVRQDFALGLRTSNIPPVANAGPDQTVSGASPSGSQVSLDGSASYDADDDPLTYEWRDAGNNVIANGATPTVFLPLGVNTITLKVSDGFGGVDTSTTQVAVTDFASSADPAGITVHSGSSATSTITLTPLYGSFNNPVTLSCSDLPSLTNCSFVPSTPVVPGANPANVTLTIHTTAATGTLTPLVPSEEQMASRAVVALTFPGALALIVFGLNRKGARRKILGATGVVLLVVMFMWAGCGGTGGEPDKRPSQSRPGTPTGTSNVTVHTNAGGLQHSTTISVTVQ